MGGRSLRILLADDDAAIREALTLDLEYLGHHVVHEARDGREALAYLATEEARRLDLVITDQIMPVVLGEVVVRAAKDLGIKAILMSADGMHLSRVARAAGADRFLLKPITPEMLQHAIDELFPGA